LGNRSTISAPRRTSTGMPLPMMVVIEPGRPVVASLPVAKNCTNAGSRSRMAVRIG
jgi:hypothetical protein